MQPRIAKARRRKLLLLHGTTYSMAAGILGAAIWTVIAFFTWREFGFLAWALGGLVGAGMAMGYEDDDGKVAGLIAALISLIAIVAAKIMIVAILAVGVAATIVVRLDDVQVTRLRNELAAGEFAQELKGRGIDEPTDIQLDLALTKARDKVDGMSVETIDQLIKAWDERIQRDPEQSEKIAIRRGDASETTGLERRLAKAARIHEPAALPAVRQPNVPGPDVPQEDRSSLMDQFFSTMFNPMDALFVLLACATAYKVGSGQKTS